jgi:effector-binding domain-containing protein
MKLQKLVFYLCLAPTLACSAPRSGERIGRGPHPEAAPQALPVSSAEGDLATIEANWKERLTQPYVYVEHRGDYRQLGEAMRRLFAEVQELGLEPTTGAPFALFYDDPGRVAVVELRARACFPVDDRPGRLGSLRYDLLPRAMVVYARVSGAYPEVQRSYPALFTYLRELGWQAGGPVREVYLVDPQAVTTFDELQTEVQIPWAARDAALVAE